VLILGRPTSRGASAGNKKLQVYRTPIPVSVLVVEDLENTSRHGSGTSTGGGGGASSFKFSGSGSSNKNSFKVKSSAAASSGHTLTAADEHAKRQWLATLQKTIDSHEANIKKKAVTTEEQRQPSSRTALFVKQYQHGTRRSPRIKASLSTAAIESLKRTGAASAVGGSASKRLK